MATTHTKTKAKGSLEELLQLAAASRTAVKECAEGQPAPDVNRLGLVLRGVAVKEGAECQPAPDVNRLGLVLHGVVDVEPGYMGRTLRHNICRNCEAYFVRPSSTTSMLAMTFCSLDCLWSFRFKLEDEYMPFLHDTDAGNDVLQQPRFPMVVPL